jgi:ABC-type antimicrobial peptide transport system permease subunit
MQAIGGARWTVASMLALEIALIGMVGGVLGALLGAELARVVGESVFHDAVEISPVLPVVIMAAAIVVALAGAWQPLRRTLQMDPAVILREGV